MKIGTIVKSKSCGLLEVIGEEHDIVRNCIVTMAVDRYGVKHPLDGSETIVSHPGKAMPKGKSPEQVMKELYAPKPGKDYPTHQEMRETVNKMVVEAMNELTKEYATIDFVSRLVGDMVRNELKKMNIH